MTSIWKKLQSSELKLMIDLEDDKKNTEESKQFMIIPKLANYSKIKYTWSNVSVSNKIRFILSSSRILNSRYEIIPKSSIYEIKWNIKVKY